MKRLGRGGLLALAARSSELALWLKVAPAAGVAAVLVILVAAVGGTFIATSSAACTEEEPEITGTVKGVPKKYVPFYVGAAKKYKLGPRGPAILAGIHRVETHFGTLDAPGVTSGVNAYGCCSGHMQFYTAPYPPVLDANEKNPSTWGQYGVDANGDGKKSPFDAEDAIYSAANYLRASGAPGNWHDAIYAYNHAEWYIDDVLGYAEQFGGFEDVEVATTAECEEPEAGGPANLKKATRLTSPRSFTTLPAKYMAYGAPQQVDTRIYDNAVYVLEEYDLVVTAARETGHATHGAGLALDMIPRHAEKGVAEWRRTAERLAKDLGWTASCGDSGVKPVCDLVPAIYGVFYNGFPSHGDPAHCSGGCPAHIHVSWMASTIAASGLTPPADWVMVFDSPSYPKK
jgi:hypothetical protein